MEVEYKGSVFLGYQFQCLQLITVEIINFLPSIMACSDEGGVFIHLFTSTLQILLLNKMLALSVKNMFAQ